MAIATAVKARVLSRELMATLTMRLLLFSGTNAPLVPCIAGVFGLRPDPEVRGVDARRIVALVADVEALRNRAMQLRHQIARRHPALAIYRETSVAIL